jgi:hypothetical protein
MTTSLVFQPVSTLYPQKSCGVSADQRMPQGEVNSNLNYNVPLEHFRSFITALAGGKHKTAWKL